MNPQEIQDALDLVVLQEAASLAQFTMQQKQASNQYTANKRRLDAQKAQLTAQLAQANAAQVIEPAPAA